MSIFKKYLLPSLFFPCLLTTFSSLADYGYDQERYQREQLEYQQQILEQQRQQTEILRRQQIQQQQQQQYDQSGGSASHLGLGPGPLFPDNGNGY